MDTQKISGGYYMKARKIQESQIMHAPPHVREIWNLFLCRACHSSNKYLQRGQLRISYKEIREALHWMIGWRKMRYSKWDCERALKLLKKATMITTRKTTVGLVVTICNYDRYQNPKNYESHTNAPTPKATREPQTTDTIYKNDKNDKNDKNKEEEQKRSNSIELQLASLLFSEIRRRKPDFKKPNLHSWSEHIEKMIRLDKRMPETIAAVIRWCQQDSGDGDKWHGWQNNILSTKTLRKQFDKLELAMNIPKPETNPERMQRILAEKAAKRKADGE